MIGNHTSQPSSSETVAPGPSYSMIGNHTSQPSSSETVAPGPSYSMIGNHTSQPISNETVAPGPSYSTIGNHTSQPSSSETVAPGPSYSMIGNHTSQPSSSETVAPGSSYSMIGNHTSQPSSSEAVAPGPSYSMIGNHTSQPSSSETAAEGPSYSMIGNHRSQPISNETAAEGPSHSMIGNHTIGQPTSNETAAPGPSYSMIGNHTSQPFSTKAAAPGPSYSMIGKHTNHSIKGKVAATAAVPPSYCSTDINECCSNHDCSGTSTICANRNCIEKGFPRFTLEWYGETDYDLIVTTPSGVVLSFLKEFDPTTGGRVGEVVDQTGLGFHTENTYFPGAPIGVYLYGVQVFAATTSSSSPAEEWVLSVNDERGEVNQIFGTGASGSFEYQRTQPSAPTTPQPAPTQQPPGSRPCTTTFDECCSDSDCHIFDASEICVNRNCIEKGNPRFTLYWEGDDDIDLFVTTPAGTELSFINVFDPLSGGRVGEETDQLGTGFHVENVIFPIDGMTLGTYKFRVQPISTSREMDRWTAEVVDSDGQVLASESGFGESDQFFYRKTSNSVPSATPPTPSPEQQSPTLNNEPTLNDEPFCSLFFDKCCSDSDCPSGLDLCVQSSCIRDGNPRFTLTWNGDDDLDLFVITSLGTQVDKSQTFDTFSGGSYQSDTNGNPTLPGPHVENIHFPLNGAPPGQYSYGVRSNATVGNANPWVLRVYDGEAIVDMKVGSGESALFTFIRDGFDGPQRPQPASASQVAATTIRCDPLEDECCLDSDCGSENEICVQRICITEGNPRITLTWNGDDNLDLRVVTPNGAVLSEENRFDAISGGRFSSDRDQSDLGLHVETVYFPDVGGSMKFSVKSVTTNGNGGLERWNLAVYEGDSVVQQYIGFGDSRDYYYQRDFNLEDQCPHECCADYDCSSNERCVQQSCIADGALRFTLAWTGNDNINLEVVTPEKALLSNRNSVDEASGGIFQFDPARGGFGFHVENVVFEDGSNLMEGEYLYSATSVAERGKQDFWELRVYAYSELVALRRGRGDSASFSYYLGVPVPTNPPVPSCESSLNECCIDSDCGPVQRCVQRICLNEGNPRFTLEWVGDDDLDLVVRTPLGAIISLDRDDPVSGGTFEPDGDQFDFGLHVESVYFRGDTTGLFQYSVDSFVEVGGPDLWKVSVFVDGQEVDSIEGTGSVSRAFLYMPTTAAVVSSSLPDDVNNSTAATTSSMIPTKQAPELQGKECFSDNDCLFGFETCVCQLCISLGNPRFTLTWTGDDVLELEIETPSGSIVSFQKPFDDLSGGYYEGDGDHDGTFGDHVDNIAFPIDSAIFGIYKYKVQSFVETEDADPWTLSIFVNDELVETKQGEGDSLPFELNYRHHY
eukprot:scaffold5688_cov104-Cylindrotheca_fusiformis.AAC.1